MGRNATITDEMVAAAANALTRAGTKPTSRAVREFLGNVGSMGTINRALQVWNAAHEQQVAHNLVLPASIQDAILSCMSEELTKGKALLETKFAMQQQEATDLSVENYRLAATITESESTLVQLNENRASLQGEIKQLEVEVAVLRNELAMAREVGEVARTELATLTLRLEEMPRLRTDLIALKNQLDKERWERVAAEQQVAVLLARLEAADELQAKADSAVAELANQLNRAAAAHHALATLHGRLEAMQAHIQRQVQELEAVRKESQRAREEAAELRGRLAGSEGVCLKIE